MIFPIQSRNFDFVALSCGFRRPDICDISKERHGDILLQIMKQKERISYLYENGLSHVFISVRNEIFPESLVPPILFSRAGMKLFEIMTYVDLKCESFLDICAGPGAMSDLLLKSYDCTGIGVTVNQCDKSLQFYQSLVNNDKFNIASPDDGDITRPEVISDVASICEAIYGACNVDLIVADGAPALNYDQENFQEIHGQKIILSEMICALECLKRHGNMVLKIFDTFTRFSRCVVYLFSKLFNFIKLIKPPSSRITNSEKYLVGLDLMIMDDKRKILLSKLQYILVNFKDGYNCEEFINLGRDSRFEQTFDGALTNLAYKQLDGLKKILDQIDYKIFKVEPEEITSNNKKGTIKGKGKGKCKGKGKNRNRRAEPYEPPFEQLTQSAPAQSISPQVPNFQEEEYSPFDDDFFPD